MVDLGEDVVDRVCYFDNSKHLANLAFQLFKHDHSESSVISQTPTTHKTGHASATQHADDDAVTDTLCAPHVPIPVVNEDEQSRSSERRELALWLRADEDVALYRASCAARVLTSSPSSFSCANCAICGRHTASSFTEVLQSWTPFGTVPLQGSQPRTTELR